MHDFFHFHIQRFYSVSVVFIFSLFIGGCHSGNELVPIEPATAKRVDISNNSSKEGTTDLQKEIPGTSVNKDASGILLSEKEISSKTENSSSVLLQKSTRIDDNNPYTKTTEKIHPPKTADRNPFDIPAKFVNRIDNRQKQTASTQYSSKNTYASFNSNDSTASLKTNEVYSSVSPNAHSNSTSIQFSHKPCCTSEPVLSGIISNGKEKLALLRWNQIHGIFRNGDILANGYYIEKISQSSVILCPPRNGTNLKSFTISIQ